MEKLNLYINLKTAIIIGLLLNFIGPTLSYFSIQDKDKAILYSITTYIADLIVVIIFSFIVSKVSNTKFKHTLEIILIMHYPMWLFDVFDIYQPLRVLSNIGLFIGLYYLVLNLKCTNKKTKIILILIYLVLYVLDASISEVISTNPLVIFILKSVF